MKTKKTLIGCLAILVGLLVLGGMAAFFAYQMWIKQPDIFEEVGVHRGGGLISKSTFASLPNMGVVSDLAWLDDNAGQTNWLAVVTASGAVVVDARTRDIKRSISFEHKGENVHAELASSGGTNDLLFLSRGSWFEPAVLIGPEGKTKWAYTGADDSGVNEACAGDLNGDGLIEVAVGFNGDEGIHLLDVDGDVLWRKPGTNIWHVEMLDITGKGNLHVAHGGLWGRLTLRDYEGTKISDTQPDTDLFLFSLSPWPKATDRPYIICVEKGRVFVLNYDGTEVAQMPASKCPPRGHAHATPVRFGQDTGTFFAVVVDYPNFASSILHIYDEDHELIYMEVLSESCAAVFALREANGEEMLLLGGENTVYAYHWYESDR